MKTWMIIVSSIILGLILVCAYYIFFPPKTTGLNQVTGKRDDEIKNLNNSVND